MQINWKIIGVVAVILVAGIVMLSARQGAIISQYYRHDCQTVSGVEIGTNQLSYENYTCTFTPTTPEESDSKSFLSNDGGFEAKYLLVEVSGSCSEIKNRVANGREFNHFYLGENNKLYLCDQY